MLDQRERGVGSCRSSAVEGEVASWGAEEWEANLRALCRLEHWLDAERPRELEMQLSRARLWESAIRDAFPLLPLTNLLQEAGETHLNFRDFHLLRLSVMGREPASCDEVEEAMERLKTLGLSDVRPQLMIDSRAYLQRTRARCHPVAQELDRLMQQSLSAISGEFIDVKSFPRELPEKVLRLRRQIPVDAPASVLSPSPEPPHNTLTPAVLFDKAVVPFCATLVQMGLSLESWDIALRRELRETRKRVAAGQPAEMSELDRLVRMVTGPEYGSPVEFFRRMPQTREVIEGASYALFTLALVISALSSIIDSLEPPFGSYPEEVTWKQLNGKKAVIAAMENCSAAVPSTVPQLAQARSRVSAWSWAEEVVNALEAGCLGSVKKLLESVPGIYFGPLSGVKSVMVHRLCRGGIGLWDERRHGVVLAFLLEQPGLDVNHTGFCRPFFTPLMVAIEMGFLSCARQLAQAGAESRRRDFDGRDCYTLVVASPCIPEGHRHRWHEVLHSCRDARAAAADALARGEALERQRREAERNRLREGADGACKPDVRRPPTGAHDIVISTSPVRPETKKLSALFQKLDVDDNGYLSKDELIAWLESLDRMGVEDSREAILSKLSGFRSVGSSSLTFDEFCLAVMRLIPWWLTSSDDTE